MPHHAPAPAPFASPFMAGFECSTHRRKDGTRLDLLAATRHDVHAAADYRRAARDGLRSARDGLRWHLIEATPGVYDWSSWLPMLRAARDAGMQVVWDLWHYGTPDWLDIWSPEFPDALARFAAAAARVHAAETDAAPCWCPLNEISFFAAIAGEWGDFHPYARGRGHELKMQLARAGVKAADVLIDADPRARLLWAEPLINVLPKTFSPADVAEAEGWRRAQFQVFDMIRGDMNPELGGRPELLDIVGANFYPHNQWVDGGLGPVPLGHHSWRPLSEMLGELHGRYGRPVMIAETGAEGSARAPWLHYVAQEVETAREAGTDVAGVCLYPVVQYPGWDDDRACQTGLYGAADAAGARDTYGPLLRELQRWTPPAPAPARSKPFLLRAG